MKSFAPLELIAAHGWRRATFTTYAFSAAFAEAVLIEALMRQGVSDITILTDLMGYRMALRERGAVRVGREYMVHPVAVPGGCFHSKLMVLEADDATHVTLGSGNLSLGGWSANLECIEHLHTNGMALAVDDVGRFFSLLADSSACEHEAREHCRMLGERLAVAAEKGRDDGAVRVVSSLEAPIAESIVATAVALGGAESLTMASPYWEASAVQRLAASLNVKEVHAHVAPSRVPAPAGMDWPRGAANVRPVQVTQFVSGEAAGRGLHAKMIEVSCTAGRLVVAGSANATSAGLLLGGETIRNVEVCAVRIDPRPGRRWNHVPAKAPPVPEGLLEEEEREGEIGVLIAAHGDTGIKGRVLTRWQAASAAVTMEVNRRPIALGTIPVAKGCFEIPLDTLEEELSLEGRIQLRLEAGAEIAEGFVTAPDFGAIKERAGRALPSMLSILKGMQTPEDVLAVMEYFRAHPEALKTRGEIRSRGPGGPADRPDPLVNAELVGRPGPTNRAGPPENGLPRDELAWQKFVARLLQAFGRAGVPTEDEDDEEDRAEKVRRRRGAEAKDRLGLRFPQLFQKLSQSVESDVELVNLARLTHFVCVTTTHPATAAFIARLVAIAGTRQLGLAARDTFAWCIAYLAAGGSEFDAASARGRMLKLGIDPDRMPDEDHAFPGLIDIIAPEADVATVLAAIRSTRTVYDDVKALEAGLEADMIPEGLSALPYHTAWAKLRLQCARAPDRRRIRFVDRPVNACPTCNIALLPHLKSELARSGICEASCHGFILARNA